MSCKQCQGKCKTPLECSQHSEEIAFLFIAIMMIIISLAMISLIALWF